MSAYIKDITGQRFGRLVALAYARRSTTTGTKIFWRCLCDCGGTRETVSADLRKGKTRSCGCLFRELINGNQYALVHGSARKGKLTRLYRIWTGMRNRCSNPSGKDWSEYGGRGITVCDEWAVMFPAFEKWAVANGYADNLSLDRIDNNRGYSPDNCRWADVKTQQANRRRYSAIEGFSDDEILAEARKRGLL